MFSCSDSFKSTAPRKSKGFSLIELMVVVAIIGIITVIALPSYQDYVVKAALIDAHTGLANGRVVAEQWYQDNRNYNFPNERCPRATQNFTFTCAQGDSAFLITATGIGRAAGFSMTVNQANARATPTAKSGWATSATCWVTGKSGC